MHRANDPEMISCRRAVELLFEYLDDELDPEMRAKVARHFDLCARCYPRLRFEESFLETVRRARSGESAPPGVRSRILQVLREEGLDAD